MVTEHVIIGLCILGGVTLAIIVGIVWLAYNFGPYGDGW